MLFRSIQGLSSKNIKTHRRRRRARRQTSSTLPVSPSLSHRNYNHSPSFDFILADLFHGIFGARSHIKMSASHASFLRDTDGISGLLKDPNTNTVWRYPSGLLSAFHEFDKLLRRMFSEGDTESLNLVVPAGYPDFQRLWNLDRDCTYQFSIYNTTTGSILPAGHPIPVDRLVPVQSADDILRQRQDEEKEKDRTYFEQRYIRNERWRQENIDKKRQERQHERTQKMIASKLFGAKPVNVGPPGGGRHAPGLVASAGVSKKYKGKTVPRNVPGPSSSVAPRLPTPALELEDTFMGEPEPLARSRDASAAPDASPIEASDRDRAPAPPASSAESPVPAPPADSPPALPPSDALAATAKSFADRVLPKGMTFKKKTHPAATGSLAQSASAKDVDVTMRDAEKEFDPNSILDYDEPERSGRKSQRKKERAAGKEKQ